MPDYDLDEIRYPLDNNSKPIYNVGTIVRDIDWDDEIFIITDIYLNEEKYITYVLRDISDMSRSCFVAEPSMKRYYVEA